MAVAATHKVLVWEADSCACSQCARELFFFFEAGGQAARQGVVGETMVLFRRTFYRLYVRTIAVVFGCFFVLFLSFF